VRRPLPGVSVVTTPPCWKKKIKLDWSGKNFKIKSPKYRQNVVNSQIANRDYASLLEEIYKDKILWTWKN
jgi:hypothetical protein